MPLPQDITPINTELTDTLRRAGGQPWVPDEIDPDRAFFKLLWTGPEKGSFAVLFRWKRGFQAPPHKHIGASHTYILSGRLQVRDGTLEAGDYTYEPNGMIHGATTALEDTDYLFIMDGALVFFNDDGLLGYISWEEMQRKHDRFMAKQAPTLTSEG